MENASKALIMAASVLLGVMIISVGVALFNSFSSFGAETVKKMEEKKIAEWNNTYLKYYGNTLYEDKTNGPIKVTAHDIVSVVNSAIQNNINYFGNNVNEWPSENYEKYYYVEVKLNNNNLEKEWCKDNKKGTVFLSNTNNILKETDTGGYEIKYYKCTSAKISNVTKRVFSISFEEIK